MFLLWPIQTDLTKLINNSEEPNNTKFYLQFVREPTITFAGVSLNFASAHVSDISVFLMTHMIKYPSVFVPSGRKSPSYELGKTN